MPINSEHLASLTDADVIDQNGDKVGGVGQIYLDDATGQPAWVSVKTGLFGMRESFVPLRTADVVDGNISVPFTKDFIKDAPRVDADNHLDDGQQSTLYSYYGVERPSAEAGEPEPRASFSSEETADEDAAGRTEGLPTSGEEATEAETQAVPSPAQGVPTAAASGAVLTDDVGTEGGVTDDTTTESVTESVTVDATTESVTESVTDDATTESVTESVTDDATTESVTDDVTADDVAGEELPPATYQQENPAANQDWSAEQAPEEPTSTTRSMPSTDPAEEEATDVSRSGYSSDQPAAHSSAYEGHEAAAESAASVDSGTPVDSGEFGTVEPVAAEDVVDDVSSGDDAVTGAPDQTGTGYPVEPEATGEATDEERPDTEDGQTGTGVGAGGAALGGAVLGGAAVGVAASDTDTTAYEVPGAETGSPTTEADPGAEFAADREEPFDAGTESGDASGEPDLSGNDPETFGPTGYRPDRDGEDMSDEERERLNQARGAL